MPLEPRIKTVRDEIKPVSAAMKAGLKAGDRIIIKVDGKWIASWRLFVTQVRVNPGTTRQQQALGWGNQAKVDWFAGVMPKNHPATSSVC